MLTFLTFAKYCRKTLQELGMRLSVSLDCQATRIVMIWDSQVSQMSTLSQGFTSGYDINQIHNMPFLVMQCVF